MGKRGILLSEENKHRAKENGLSLQTVYGRLKRGWEVERAITEPPQSTNFHNLPRSPTGEVTRGEHKKGRLRSIRFWDYMDEEIDKAIAASGMNQSDWVTMAVEEYYQKLWKPPRKQSKRQKKQ